MEGYDSKDNAGDDETGLKVGKYFKEKLIVFLCTFMTGEIKSLMVTGNAVKPHFKNINTKELPVIWEV
jgi:hypothetical protein